jgi:hypothetical protein
MGDLMRDFAPHELVELSDAELDAVAAGQNVSATVNQTGTVTGNATAAASSGANGGNATATAEVENILAQVVLVRG